jgi:hypothetical protein
MVNEKIPANAFNLPIYLYEDSTYYRLWVNKLPLIPFLQRFEKMIH